VSCTWCGAAVVDGFRVSAPQGHAEFCRLEHIVPWAIRGATWEAGAPGEAVGKCTWCGADALVLVVRSRGEHEVRDGFCGVEHLLAWAKAGGRYR
jgi:hypothetical protein